MICHYTTVSNYIVSEFCIDFEDQVGQKVCLQCIKRESNPRRVDGNDPGYHYPINATKTEFNLTDNTMPAF